MEEIIIDGVDVAGCKYINKECAKDFSNCGHICKGTECKYKRFHYKDKQLKRIEQENKELKQTIKDLTQSLDDCNVQRTQLKARLTPLEDSYFNGLSSIEIAGLAKKSIRITTYNRQLETALEEIREMLPESKCKYACFSCPESGQCKEEWAEPIKRIITEAIGE